MTGEELALLGRTAVHLRPAQVAHRARLRVQRTALQRWPEAGQRLLTDQRLLSGQRPAVGPGSVGASGWPPGFAPLDATALTVTVPRHWPSLAELSAGRITLLGVTRHLGDPPDWAQVGVPRLWRFHLHYWDWAWGLAAADDRVAAREVFARLWRSWRAACGFGRGDPWLPYPAALRAWSWCGLYADLVAGTDLAAEFRRELTALAGFLRVHLECDVGGNHLIKDLKALVGLSIFLRDEPMLRRALRLLHGQLPVQVLADGGHYERAPAYHCQVLADLIDVADLLSASGRVPAPALTLAIARMRRWLGAVLTPDGAVPLLNDGYPVPGALVTALRPLPAPDVPLLTLAETGLIRATAGDWHLLADVGAPCPDDLPAHAHADTLSCVMHAAGTPLLVDTGTSTYAPGRRRSFERSTAAHSTLEIDGCDSTEVWGAFRAGRRARVRILPTSTSPDGVTFGAVHDGFRRLPGRPAHQRRWSVARTGVRVNDLVTGTGRHTVVVRWHLAPGATVRLEARGAVTEIAGRTFLTRVEASAPVALSVESGRVAEGFMRGASAPVLTCLMTAALPLRVSTCWRAGTDAGESL